MSGARRGNRLGREELLAVALAAGKTLKQAAKAAGVCERTAQTWFKEPKFKVRVAVLRGEVVSRALGRMTDGMTSAADTLRKLLRSKTDAVRLGAAKALIELPLKVREATDLQAQISHLWDDMEDVKTNPTPDAPPDEPPANRRNEDGFGDDPSGPASDQNCGERKPT